MPCSIAESSCVPPEEGQANGSSSIQGYRKEDTYMDVALKAIQELMKQHIIGNPKDRMAVIFYAAVRLNEGCQIL